MRASPTPSQRLVIRPVSIPLRRGDVAVLVLVVVVERRRRLLRLVVRPLGRFGWFGGLGHGWSRTVMLHPILPAKDVRLLTYLKPRSQRSGAQHRPTRLLPGVDAAGDVGSVGEAGVLGRGDGHRG